MSKPIYTHFYEYLIEITKSTINAVNSVVYNADIYDIEVAIKQVLSDAEKLSNLYSIQASQDASVSLNNPSKKRGELYLDLNMTLSQSELNELGEESGYGEASLRPADYVGGLREVVLGKILENMTNIANFRNKENTEDK